MNTFSIQETYYSILSAAVYGCFFSFLCTICYLLTEYAKMLFFALKCTVIYDGSLFSHLSKSDIKKEADGGLESEIFAAIKTVIFFLGLLLVSYVSLDGDIRIYVVAVAACTFYLSDKLLVRFFTRALIFLFDKFIYVLTVFLRIILFPLRLIFVFAYKKLHKSRLLLIKPRISTLDNNKKQ